MPVVQNLEDLWKVSRLQNQRKAREEKAKQQKLEVRRAGSGQRRGGVRKADGGAHLWCSGRGCGGRRISAVLLRAAADRRLAPPCASPRGRVQGMRTQLEQAFGAPQLPTEEEVVAAVKEIVTADILQQQKEQQPNSKRTGGTQAAQVLGGDAAAAPAVGRNGRAAAGRGGRAGLQAAAAALAQLD